jgi:hypothetical protein
MGDFDFFQGDIAAFQQDKHNLLEIPAVSLDGFLFGQCGIVFEGKFQGLSDVHGE